MFRKGEFADLILIVVLIMIIFSVLPMYIVYLIYPEHWILFPILVFIFHMMIVVPYIVRVSSESTNFIGKYVGVWYGICQIIVLLYIRYKEIK
jgi:hypothetical protein